MDPTLGLSSLPILVRSSLHIILNYQAVFDNQRYVNCAWPVLARVVVAGHVILQGFVRRELRRGETQELLAVVLYLLDKLATRCPAASSSSANFRTLILAFGAFSVCWAWPFSESSFSLPQGLRLCPSPHLHGPWLSGPLRCLSSPTPRLWLWTFRKQTTSGCSITCTKYGVPHRTCFHRSRWCRETRSEV